MTVSSVDLPLRVQAQRYDFIAGVKQGPFNDGTPRVAYRRWMSKDGVDTPNFRLYLRKNLWKPENKYLYQKEEVKNPQGYPFLTIYWIPTGDYSEYHGPCDVSNQWNDIVYFQPTSEERQAIADRLGRKILEKIKGQNVNLGVFYAERTQTLNLFGDTARRLADACNALRRKQFGKAFERLRCPPSRRISPSKSLANNWLELQYGWLPLLDDLYGASKELENAWDESKQRTPLKRVVSRERWARQDRFASSVIPGMAATRESICDFKFQVNYTVDVESLAFLGRMGLTNPTSILWEKLPWSFVVDWFLPVGRFLNTLDATIGCTYRSGTSSGISYCHLRDFTHEYQYVSGNYRYVWKGSDARGRYVKYERASLGGFPAVKLPQPKNPLSAQHCANALALLTQAFRK